MPLQQASFGRLLEPGLRKIFFETYKELPEQYKQIFNVQTSTKAIETDLRMGGFGLWEKKGSMDSVVYQDTVDPQALQYIHEEFASGFTIERKLVDDENYNQINKYPKSLARTARQTVEIKATEILNKAFTQNGFDGVPLISGSHKRLDGGTMNNSLGTSTLTDANLKAGLVEARTGHVDERGLKIQAQPKILVIPPALEWTANTILKSNNISTTGNGTAMTNDTNLLKGQLKLVVMDYLDSDTAWFLIDPMLAELNFFWRKKLEFKNTEDFDTMQAKYRGYMRFSVGYSDYRGILGSTGTGA